MAGRMRGQPVVALLAVLCGWAGGRLSAWDSQPALVAPAAGAAVGAKGGAEGGEGYRVDPMTGPLTLAGSYPMAGYPVGGYPLSGYPAGGYPVSAYPGAANVAGPPAYAIPGYMAAGAGYARTARMRGARVTAYPGEAYEAYTAGWQAAGRDMAAPAPMGFNGAASGWEGERAGREFMATPIGPASRDRLPAGLPSFALLSSPLPIDAAPGGSAQGTGTPPGPALRRWSADSWALLRRNGTGPLANGALPATYGASQTGAIVRYRLALRSAYRPEVYLRTTTTLGQAQRETAAAIGLAARPLPTLPVVAAVEGRMTEFAGKRRFQPVAMAITALPPFELPYRLRGEAYGQAGYVAGAFETPFAEGQLRVDRGLFSLGRAEARLGGGVWGGAQKGASRLDAGPSATLALPLARNVFGRVAVDWRFRVAGDAKPDSGPALTLSAGF